MLLTTNTTIDKITSYVSQMSEIDQKVILEALMRREMMAKAAKLNKSVNRKLKISTSEIVSEIRKIRVENADKRSRI